MIKKQIYQLIERLVIITRRYRNPRKVIYRMFYKRTGYYPDLDNPKTFNEKLQWLKLNNHNPLYTRLVDKALVKEDVAGIIGEEYIIPTLNVWDRFEDIDFDALPRQFVLKCTHDSGGLVICKDKQTLDRARAKKKIKRSLATNYYYLGYEWPYKDVKPRIIAEPYMEDAATGEMRDYKFYLFNGTPRFLMIGTDRDVTTGNVNINFYDLDFNQLSFKWGNEHSSKPLARPKQFELMKQLASRLAGDIPFVRVDFYEVNGKVYFGEMTFFPAGGWTPFTPSEWDSRLGSWLDLTMVKQKQS